MKDHSKMSDAELNQLITCFQFDCHDWPQNINGDFYHCCFDGDSYFVIGVKDYCNNPSDAWPIIKTNHINIGWAGDEEWFARTVHTAKVFDANPLRAAMIVYLMMKDE